MSFRQVTIVGTGLLGASFGLALKQHQLASHIVGVGGAAPGALHIGAIDEIAGLPSSLPASDLVLLAQPIQRLLSTLEQLDEHLSPTALVTDVGSTKSEICRVAAQHIRRANFVGGHPMAGKEQRGPQAASAALFAGCTWVLTAHEPRLEQLIQTLGAHPLILGPVAHDRLVAQSSHLPQLLSTALASYLEGSGAERVSGPGLRDMTRLALSNYELWEDIIATNRDNIDAALSGLIAHLESLRQSGFQNAFPTAQSFANKIPRDV